MGSAMGTMVGFLKAKHEDDLMNLKMEMEARKQHAQLLETIATNPNLPENMRGEMFQKLMGFTQIAGDPTKKIPKEYYILPQRYETQTTQTTGPSASMPGPTPSPGTIPEAAPARGTEAAAETIPLPPKGLGLPAITGRIEKPLFYTPEEQTQMALSQRQAALPVMKEEWRAKEEIELPGRLAVASSRGSVASIPGLVEGKDLSLPNDTAGRPIDPEASYHVMRDNKGAIIGATKAEAGVSWRTDWKQDPDSSTGFSRVMYDKSGKVLEVLRDILPPTGYLGRSTQGVRFVQQPDGTIAEVPVTTVRSPVLPPVTTEPSTGATTPKPTKPGAGPAGKTVGGRFPQQVTRAYEAATDSDNRLYIMKAHESSPSGQGDVSLLFNHIGMTLGAQKGARITDAEIRKAMKTRSLPEDVMARIQSWGIAPDFLYQMIGMDPSKYPPGGFLTPQQRKNMVDLAVEMRDVVWWKANSLGSAYGSKFATLPNPSLPPPKQFGTPGALPKPKADLSNMSTDELLKKLVSP